MSEAYDMFGKKESMSSYFSTSGDLVQKIRSLENEVSQLKFENTFLKESSLTQNSKKDLKDKIEFLQIQLENSQYGFQKLLKSS